MKITHRRHTPSDYSTRAARVEAKKLLLERIVELLNGDEVCGYENTTIADSERFSKATESWPDPWRAGVRHQMHEAVQELRAEFQRRAAR